MKLFKTNKPSVPSTSFSDFIRNASAADKKKAYAEVLEKATERQNRLLNPQAQPAK